MDLIIVLICCNEPDHIADVHLIKSHLSSDRGSYKKLVILTCLDEFPLISNLRDCESNT